MGIGDWINRRRHNRGFGIQSPSTFFFITQVLRERLPYYAYPTLENVAEESSCSSRALKELFRITNHLQPKSCIAVESPTAACAMALARPGAQHCSLTDKEVTQPLTTEILERQGCQSLAGDTAQRLQETLARFQGTGMVYIGKDCTDRTIVQKAIEQASDSSVIVMEAIHSSKERKQWWQSLVNSDSTVITFDMYSYGLLFFSHERYKQHYNLKR